MSYEELQTAIIQDSHRDDLGPGEGNVNLIPRFIREGEDMIRRELTAYILTTTITESARQANPSQYSLPTGILVIRRLALQGQLGPGLTRSSLDTITSYPVSNRVALYVEPGDGLIEFRGTPPEGAIFELNYYGMPPRLVNPDDTNTLLEENETLYKAAAMFSMFANHTQDRELASDQIEIFNSIMETLNEQIARKIGGTKITASYQFGNGGSY